MSDLTGELAALREGAGVCVPGLRAVIGVRGPDHLEWLERITSVPLQGLVRGQARWTTLMDGKGRLRADLRVLAAGPEDGLLLEIPTAHLARLLAVLDLYILRDRVSIDDRTASHTFVAVLGPRTGAVLAQARLPVVEPGAGADETLALAQESEVLAVPSRLYGVPGADLLVPTAQADAVVARARAAGAVPVSMQALQLARITRGVPWFPDDLAGDVIPLEAGLSAHVSVTKGCYPGQEVVARIHNLGQVARKLVRLVADGQQALEAGAVLHGTGERAQQEAGRLTSVARDPQAGCTRALGFVRRAFWRSGTAVRCDKVELRVEGDARP